MVNQIILNVDTRRAHRYRPIIVKRFRVVNTPTVIHVLNVSSSAVYVYVQMC